MASLALEVHAPEPVGAEERVRQLELVQRIGLALSAEQNRERLLETILLEAQKLCRADGGTLYLRTENDNLRFAIVHTESLGLHLGGVSGEPVKFSPLPLYDANAQPNMRNVATCCALTKQIIHVPDAYHTSGFDFSGTLSFDRDNDYRTQSVLAIPLINQEDTVIGVLQLINARDPSAVHIAPFRSSDMQIVEVLASQAAVALDNQNLLAQQKALLESFIQTIAAAIDAKSPHTGGHCERVPQLTLMLAEAAIRESKGPLQDFTLSADELYELKIAAWLHDCGKVTTPVHVIDKSTKLETIVDRIEAVKTRFLVLKRDAEIAHLKRLAQGADAAHSREAYEQACEALDQDFAFLSKHNRGSEFLSDEDQRRIERIAQTTYLQDGVPTQLLSENELDNLRIARGTLTQEERVIINRHMVETLKMLTKLPFPRNLRRVPEYAGGHHERMDGNGYPRGLYAADMSVPARIMAVADVFEALTAQDRPYKSAMKLSQAMQIMGNMKRDNHLDPDVFDVFVRSRVYRTYGERYLAPELLDAVDEAALLAITPKPCPLPPLEERRKRWQGFMAPYDE